MIKKGCTQTAYVGSLVTMLVLHADPLHKIDKTAGPF